MVAPTPIVVFDTSVLIAALNGGHQHHASALPWLVRAKLAEIAAVVSAHTISEIYGYFTGHDKRSPSSTRLVIDRDILAYMQVVSLTASEYIDVIDNAVRMELQGGVIYDAIHAAVALKVKADTVLTINKRDFFRTYTGLNIVVP